MSRTTRKLTISLVLSAKAIRHLNRVVQDDPEFQNRSRSNAVDHILLQHEDEYSKRGEVNEKS